MLVASFQIGTIASWLTLAVLLVTTRQLSRGGAGAAVGELSKANEVLERRLHEERQAKERLGAEVRDLHSELAELRGRTDFAVAIAGALRPVISWTITHEERAQERHDRALAILSLIAERLGPDDDAPAV